MKRPFHILLVLLVVALALLAAPHLVGEGLRGLLSKMLIAALFATAYSVMSGQAGLLSFGHAAFFGTGAIVTMHVMLIAQGGGGGLPSVLLPLAGAFGGAACAAVAGAISSRRVGSYFTLITLAFAELVHILAIQWKGFFGGEAGLTSMRMPWGGFNFASAMQVYYAVLFWVVLGVLACWAFTKTGFGRLATGIRENEERVTFLGFNTYLSKIIIFVVSGFMSGLAGGLLAFANESATYTIFSPLISLEVVFQVFIGGTALFLGPALAAAVLTLLPYALADYTRLWPLYQGVLFMALMYFAPGGFSGLVKGRGWSGRSKEEKKNAWRGVLLAIVIGTAFVGAAELTRHIVEAPQRATSLFEGLGLNAVALWSAPAQLLLVWALFFIVSILAWVLGVRRNGLRASQLRAHCVKVVS